MEPLLDVCDIKKYFYPARGLLQKRRNPVRAVDGVSFSLQKGETLGMVGESGCGKTTLGRVLLRLVEPTAGTIIFKGRDITALNKQQLRTMRREMQFVFQDPFGSLNPRMKAGSIIEEPLVVYQLLDKPRRSERVHELLDMVGLRPQDAQRYPHAFSGGQRQRIGIARALSLNPTLIIADEPVSALDVSVQAQILNLLNDLKSRFHLTYIFISHDLHVVHHMSDRIVVMYLGRIVETAPSETLYADPRHPYTKALLAAVPVPGRKRNTMRLTMPGDVPDPAFPPPGCRFHPRCPEALPVCKQHYPAMHRLSDGHMAACHLYA